MYVKSKKVDQPNFLASAKFQNFTQQVDDTGVTANSEGKKIVPAGSVYKNANGVAIGLLFNDADVTNGPQPVAVMYQGIVYGARLPKAVSDEDKAKMPGIIFKDDYDSREEEVSYVATTDTKYQAGTTYYSKTNDVYKKLVAGTDYTVGDNITGTIYVAE